MFQKMAKENPNHLNILEKRHHIERKYRDNKTCCRDQKERAKSRNGVERPNCRNPPPSISEFFEEGYSGGKGIRRSLVFKFRFFSYFSDRKVNSRCLVSNLGLNIDSPFSVF